jgi:hypothetical protein
MLASSLALLPLVWRLGEHALAVLTFPWQIDFDEGIILRAAWMLAQGQNPYHAPRPDAFTSATYPPLFYVLNAVWLWLSGPTLLSGRVISLVAALVIGGLLAWWVWLECRSRLAALLAALVWLSLSPVYVWSTFFKPDMLALGLTVGGLVLARRWAGWPGLGWAAVVFALAFFTKQSALVGPLAAGLWLLTDRRPRRVPAGPPGPLAHAADRWPWLAFGLLTGGLIVGPFALANAVVRGGLWLHVVSFQQLPWGAGQLMHNLGKLAETYPWLLAAAGLATLALLVARWRPAPAARPVAPPSALPLWYLVAAIPAVLVANGRLGVNFGLLLDLFPPLCLLIGVAAGTLRQWPGRWWPALSGVVCGLVLVQALVPNPPGEWYSTNRMPSRERASRMRSVANLVEQTPGRLLSEDLWLLLRAGKPVEYDDTFLMAQTAQRGLWDERRFVADLEAQRFALVLLEYDITDVPRSPRWSPAALAALRANYEILHRDVVFVHRPRSLLRAPGTRQDADFGGQVRLVETAVSTTATRPGGTVRVMLRWRRAAAPTADYTLFLHVIDPSGTTRAQVDVPPGARPTTVWAANEQAEAEYALTVADDAPPGRYQIVVGLYDPVTGQRLPVTRAGAAAGDALALAELRVGDD